MNTDRIIQLLAQRLAQAEINAAYAMAQLEEALKRQRELEARIAEIERHENRSPIPPTESSAD